VGVCVLLIDWLKYIDDFSAPCVILYSYSKSRNEIFDDEPIYAGTIRNIPWPLAMMPLFENNSYEDSEVRAISFRDNLGETYNNRPGLVIIVQEE
jgi:hypothetical protein